MIEHSGGRAGPNEYGWIMANYELEELDALRQQLLKQNDVGKVQQAMRKLGLGIKRSIIQAVKNYNFDSQGLAFTYPNYAAWRRLATGKGTLGDASYLIHEIAEVQELQRIQSQTGFNFIGPKNLQQLSSTQRRQWRGDFRRYYLQAHSKALEAEYEFIAKQVAKVTNGAVKLSKLQAAVIDPTRQKEAWQYLLINGSPIEEHYKFDAWRQRANEAVPLSKAAQQRLNYHLPTIMLELLIVYLKNISIE